MPAGRPPKYTSVEETKFLADGEVCFKHDSDLRSQEFNRESDLAEYIEVNICKFCNEMLSGDIISHALDYPIIAQNRFSPRGRRVDLYIETTEKKYVIELKNPKNLIENRQGIGQLLDYGREFLGSEKELLLITTRFDINTAKTIQYYNLPIRYILMTKSQSFEYKGEMIN